MFKAGDRVLVSDNPSWNMDGQEMFNVVDKYAGMTGVVSQESYGISDALFDNYVVSFPDIKDAALFNPKCLTKIEV